MNTKDLIELLAPWEKPSKHHELHEAFETLTRIMHEQMRGDLDADRLDALYREAEAITREKHAQFQAVRDAVKSHAVQSHAPKLLDLLPPLGFPSKTPTPEERAKMVSRLIVELLAANPPAPLPAATDAAAGKSETPGEQTAPATRAIALLLAADREGRTITKKAIAKMVGVHRDTLGRDPQFAALWDVIKAKNKASIPKGSKDAAGNVEAEYDPDDE